MVNITEFLFPLTRRETEFLGISLWIPEQRGHQNMNVEHTWPTYYIQHGSCKDKGKKQKTHSFLSLNVSTDFLNAQMRTH